jgi:dihydroceramide fatty acyl 2-hydroxylase
MSNNPEESIRLFKNDFMESLSHVHPIVPLLLWSPIAGVLLYRSFAIHQLPLLAVLGIGVLAVISWTLVEYWLHRIVFHWPAKSKFGKWFVYMFHGLHHDAPQDKTRLVMPPAPAILIMGLLWYLFSLLIPMPWLEPFLGFFVIGYLIYDYIHYATHHFRMKGRVGGYLRRYHLQHHFSKPNGHFGVSSPMWDIIFRTR